MRYLFRASLLSTLLTFSSNAMAADGYLAKPGEADSTMNFQRDSVQLAGCEVASACSGGCNDNTGILSSCNKPMKISTRGCDVGDWLDNTTVSSGAEAFKSIGDTFIPPGPASGYMNSAGFVNGINTGFRLGNSKIRGQIGGSLGIYDLKGRDTSNTAASETQVFSTTGVFKRSDVTNGDRVSWGLVYDQLWNSQYGQVSDDIYLGQFRGIVGLALNECNEVGVWGTAKTNSDATAQGFNGAQGLGTQVESINQYNLFLSHNFSFGARSMFYIGTTDHSSIGSWTTGSQLVAPMSPRVSLYGNTAFLFPSSTVGATGSNEYLWAISTGLNYSFGKKSVSRNISGQAGMPLLPVANNGTFLIGNK